MSIETITGAVDYIAALKYDEWYLFLLIPEDIKEEVIIQMDECVIKNYTFIWEGDWFKKTSRYQY